MATHSSILAWRIPWTEESGGYMTDSPQGHKESDRTEHMHTHILWISKEWQQYVDISLPVVKDQFSGFPPIHRGALLY